jgi:3-methylcrotonyl-CoA carboxylase alpha subunit
VVEEAPAPDLPATVRERMGEVAVRAAKAINYRGAGTVEFLYDPDTQQFHFMEMNTRLQVEHPVTELITGIDLVEWQLRVAAGEPLPLTQQQVRCDGHAIEVRLYAEDPARDFVPATGPVRWLDTPDDADVRVDAGVRAGDAVGVHYDPMIAKLIVHAPDRAATVARLRSALAATRIGPLVNNVGFLRAITAHPQWSAGAVDTGFLGREQDALTPAEIAADDALLGAAAWFAGEPAPAGSGPWQRLRGFRLNLPPVHRLRLAANGEPACDAIVSAAGDTLHVQLPGRTRTIEPGARSEAALAYSEDGARRRIAVHLDDSVLHLDDGRANASVQVLATASPAGADQHHGAGQLIAPMPGRVVSLAVALGDRVERGQAIVVLEAMKMEHTLSAPAAGSVEHVGCAEGEQVEEGSVLVALALD